MKGIDATVLLGVLRGESASAALVKRLRGEEVAMTEMDLLESFREGARGSPADRKRRNASLERVRRAITVLPMDAAATNLAAARISPKTSPESLANVARLSCLEVHGCDELFSKSARQPEGHWKVRVTRIGRTNPE